jgi:hypothetical protein
MEDLGRFPTATSRYARATSGRPAQIYDQGRYPALGWHQNRLRHP